VSAGELQEVNAGRGAFEGPKQWPASPEAVLKELFLLLEEYGPQWYTQDHHNRAVAALLQTKEPMKLGKQSGSRPPRD
jgi:hypothetical protein